MSFATARRDIEGRFMDNWATTRIKYDNINFKPPRGDEYWVQCKIFEDNTNRINIGTPGIHRVSGTIIIELYAPLNDGTQTIRSYADDVAAIFRDAQFNGVQCREAVPTNIGESDGWYQYMVSVPFFYDGVY